MSLDCFAMLIPFKNVSYFLRSKRSPPTLKGDVETIIWIGRPQGSNVDSQKIRVGIGGQTLRPNGR